MAALQLEAVSTYAADRFVSVDVAGLGHYDGAEYQSRIVVAETSSGWYAIPRCRSSKTFYAIADTMQLTVTSTAASNVESPGDERQVVRP